MSVVTVEAEKRFYNNLKVCSVIASVLVVWIHAYNAEVYRLDVGIGRQVQDVWSQFVARSAVPFFFFISAFHLYNCDKRRTIKEVYVSRFYSVVRPYLLWNGIYMMAFAILTKLSLSQYGMKTFTVENVLRGIFFYKYNYSYWFMWRLIIYIAAYPIVRAILRMGRGVSATCGIFLIVGQCVGIVDEEGFVFYFLGALVSFCFKEEVIAISTIEKRKSLMIALIMLVFAIFARYVYLLDSLVWEMALILFIWFLTNAVQLNAKGELWGMSFMIYSMHPIILESVEKIIYRVLPNTITYAMLDYVLAPVITLCIIVNIVLGLKRYFPYAHKVLSGGR